MAKYVLRICQQPGQQGIVEQRFSSLDDLADELGFHRTVIEGGGLRANIGMVVRTLTEAGELELTGPERARLRSVLEPPASGNPTTP